MSFTYVALDLEMTGIDAEADEIIEIGAVRFSGTGPTETYRTFVNPGRALPRRIESLTGITRADLADAPAFGDVADDLIRFVADAPVVGQHVDWDLKFLARNGVVPEGPVYDTAELAELLLPGRSDYALRNLVKLFGIDFPVQHRALPDAEASMRLFLKLRERLLSVEPAILDEIGRLTANSGWGLRYLFRELVATRGGGTVSVGEIDNVALDVARRAGEAIPPLAANQHVLPLLPEEACQVFSAAGENPAEFPTFEPRPEQERMAGAVAAALSADGQLIVEAGTGTGKSLAYLVPAALFALRNNARVLVTTNTINLQEQIAGKDVPELYRLLENGAPEDIRPKVDDLRVTQLKGRRNYICLQRLAAMRRAPVTTDAEAKFLTRLLLWLQSTETGDRAELPLKSEEEPLWARVCAQNTTCFAGPSYYVRNGSCQLLRARKRADSSHIVVANHALLLSDLASGGRALPQYERLIIDEAHNLEDEATQQFGFQAGQGHFNEYLDSLQLHASGRDTGLVPTVHEALRLVPATDPAARIHALADAVAEAANHARARIPEVFGRVNAFILNHGGSDGDYDNRLLLDESKRAQPEWSEVEIAWENARLALLPVEDTLAKLAAGLADAETAEIIDYDNLLGAVQTAMQSGQALRKGVDEMIERHEGERIKWLTTNRLTGAVSFSSAPLHVGEVLEDYLFGRKQSVVLTSATLSTAGGFAYVKERLNLGDASEMLLGSPFDYKRSALVLVPSDIPQPAEREYQKTVEKAVIDLCTASKGRALVLFTSHAALRATYHAVKRPLERAGIAVLGQGLDGTAKELVEQLRSDGHTVLLGTSSFWEGVDVVGEALSLLIIAKLPFAVPSDPVFRARSEQFEDRAFSDYALPQAGLKFKQGFGRLIRHKSDRGVMVVLDRRLISKSYGRSFLDALPPCSRSQAPLDQLPAIVARWLTGRGTAAGEADGSAEQGGNDGARPAPSRRTRR